jgi:hypothetical protein
MSHAVIVAKLFSELGLPCQVDEDKIVSSVDEFTVKNGSEKRSGRFVRVSYRIELSAVRAKRTVEFPIGDRMNSTIKKFLAEVKTQIAELDAQPERSAELARIGEALDGLNKVASKKYVGSQMLCYDGIIPSEFELTVNIPIKNGLRVIEALKGIL